MTYQEAVDFLSNETPMFQKSGNGAYHTGLETAVRLDETSGHPHRSFHTVHIAGTNGKGSTAHTIAAIFQAAGYRTGLYTSPHLTDFRERIRVDGIRIVPEYVTDFLEKTKDIAIDLHASFFEITTAMAFSYFASCNVDVAIIETGLGGRFDSTNIITPDLSVITNIGFDHIKILGNTLAEIAFEKAGIIKPGVPVVIGEDCPETRPVFQKKADECNSKIVFAQDNCKILSTNRGKRGEYSYNTIPYPNLESGLQGYCQYNNANTILHCVEILNESGWNLTEAAVRTGFADVCRLTGLRGRWEKLCDEPLMICDTGHNSHGLKYISEHLKALSSQSWNGVLRIVFGMVNDKDTDVVLGLMPTDAVWYFAQASVPRALPSQDLREKAKSAGLDGKAYPSVAEAVTAARADAAPNDIIFVGGSTFVVSDLLNMEDFRDQQ